MEVQKSAIIVGAGIVGLAHALACAKHGFNVTVIERNPKAVGASIRNFGMVWPIGQPPGATLNRALNSRKIWKEVAVEAQIFHDEVGSLHLAYREDEYAVLKEFFEASTANKFYDLTWVDPEDLSKFSRAAKIDGFLGGVFSSTEMIVDPREAIANLPRYLTEKYGVNFIWNTVVQHCTNGKLSTAKGDYTADEIIVCSGPDFETLYPEIFAKTKITKCKLQMMRTVPQPNGWRLGASLAGGLTLTHYKAFQDCASIGVLQNRIETETPHFPAWGIHVMASQNGLGEVVIGDSHEYGLHHDPFDRAEVNTYILDYLKTFLQSPTLEIGQSWHGVYPKMTNGSTEFVCHPEQGITLVNGLGGAGMTLSFGLAEEVVKSLVTVHAL